MQEVRGTDETGEKRKPRPRPEKDKSIVAESGERVTMPEDIGPSPSIAAVGTLVTADSVVEATRTEGQEDRSRRRRRRRGRGGRSENGADVVTPGNGTALTAERVDDELTFAEQPADEPYLDEAQPSALVNEPLMETVTLIVPSEPVHEVVAVSNITAVRVPPLVTAPTMIALPVVQQAPLPIDELQPVLQSAGLMLVQTAPERHAETQAKMAAEPPPPHARRERPLLPPMDDAPLVQVETQRPSQERANV